MLELLILFSFVGGFGASTSGFGGFGGTATTSSAGLFGGTTAGEKYNVLLNVYSIYIYS